MSTHLTIDVVLLGDETPEEVKRELETRFAVTADIVDSKQHVTYTITGDEQQLRRVKGWHGMPRGPRPDLRGKPPVGKGERRV